MPYMTRYKSAQAGSVVIEFSVVLILFLTIAFGVVELARTMYLYITLQEVTRRAAALAASSDFSNPATMDKLRQNAVFRDTPGPLIFGAPITDAHVRIDYLSLADNGSISMAAIPASALPACPVNNRITCMKDPHHASCIRLVRARICDPATTDSCNKVQYESIFSLVSLPLSLPTSTTIVAAETLGATIGSVPCP